MPKVLQIVMESYSDSHKVFIALSGDETEEQIDELARCAFFEWANYGHSVIDASDVPSDAEVIQA